MSREEGRQESPEEIVAKLGVRQLPPAPRPPPPNGESHYGGFSTPLLEGDRPKPRFRTLAEFIAEYKPIAEVIAGVLISGSLCTMTATTGTGKTALNRFDHRHWRPQKHNLGAVGWSLTEKQIKQLDEASSRSPVYSYCISEATFPSATRLRFEKQAAEFRGGRQLSIIVVRASVLLKSRGASDPATGKIRMPTTRLA